MPVSSAKLSAGSPAAKMLAAAIENGTISFKSTAKQLKDSPTALGRALLPYTTKSVNNFLANLRRKRDNNGMLCYFIITRIDV